MQRLFNIFTEMWNWLTRPANLDNLIAGALVTIFFGVLVFVFRKAIPRSFIFLRRSLADSGNVPAGLFEYRQRLNTNLASLKHSWMKEDQTLKDIWVPVSVVAEGGMIDELSSVVRKRISESKPAARIVITGKPGAGKSVALQTVALDSWNYFAQIEQSKIPVIITFKEYRLANWNLATAIEAALNQYGYNEARSGRPCSEFVRDMISIGRFLVLLDALDELGSDDRTDAAIRIVQELSSPQFSSTAAVITCRSAAWIGMRNVFASVPAVSELHLAEFTPLAIRRFVHNWRFTPPKSAGELLSVIQKQPHVGELAKNPLLLTIVCFLYSQPKYRLPENRAQFYEVCVRALLEEWNQATRPDKANKFDRPHKEICLGALAYEHISGSKPDDDMQRDSALVSLANSMAEISLNPAERTQFLDEIIENSGLLNTLPPTGLRFPHKTFTEFFAARHLLRTANSSILLQYFNADAERWREVLLLWCGLSESVVETDTVLAALLDIKNVDTALAIMVDARTLSNDMGKRVLDAAASAQPTPTMLANLGYIGANPRSSHAESARKILFKFLTALLNLHFPSDLTPDLVAAAMRCADDRMLKLIETHADALRLQEVIPALGERLLPVAIRIVADRSIPVERRCQWIDAMQRSGAVQALFQLAVSPDLESEVRASVEFALMTLSNLPEWWQEIENVPESTVLAKNLPAWAGAQAAAKRWPWIPKKPTAGNARIMIAYLCTQTCDRIAQPSIAESTIQAIHPLLHLMCVGILAERSSTNHGMAAHMLGQHSLTSFDHECFPNHFVKRSWNLACTKLPARVLRIGEAWEGVCILGLILFGWFAVLGFAWAAYSSDGANRAIGFAVLVTTILMIGFSFSTKINDESGWKKLLPPLFFCSFFLCTPLIFIEALRERKNGGQIFFVIASLSAGFVIFTISHAFIQVFIILWLLCFTGLLTHDSPRWYILPHASVATLIKQIRSDKYDTELFYKKPQSDARNAK